MKPTQLIIIGGVVLLLVGAVVFFMNMNKAQQTPGSTIMEKEGAPEEGTQMEQPVLDESGEGVTDMVVEGAVKEFTVVGTPFQFDVAEIRVKKGDTVKILFKNGQGMHDWVVDEFNAKTKQLQTGEEEAISFVADKAGTFEYYCSVGNHRAQGMVGKLIVEE